MMTRKNPAPRLVALSAALSLAALYTFGDGAAIAPKFLLDDAVVAQVTEGATATIEGGALRVKLPGGPAGYPGVTLRPKEGETWNLSPWGRIEARVTNTSDENLHVNLRVDNPGDWRTNPWNAEAVFLKPGESKTVSVYFGYSYGHKPADYVVDSSRVSALLFFSGKSANDRSFVVEDLQAIGAAGNEPPVDPARRAVVPKDGILFGTGASSKLAYVEAKAKPDGPTSVVTIPSGKRGAVKIQPEQGYWDLGSFTDVRVAVRNRGAAPLALAVRLDSAGGNSAELPATVPPGQTMHVEIPFEAPLPWAGEFDHAAGKGRAIPGTGTVFASCRTTSVTVLLPAAPEEREVEIVDARAVLVHATIPKWLGRRPPVEGDWVQTLAEEFDGPAVDESRWNVRASNYWDKRTHFSRDNVVLGGGLARLHYEKKTGFQNDDPDDKSAVQNSPYACGILTSYGKWTQRYGYFEARMKLPRAPGLWPAFWTMPDRGADFLAPGDPEWKRHQTGDGGMEFDIMEHLTRWGPHRFNIACHWDGYGKNHRAIGTGNVYMRPDADGFITVGLLWLPGEMAVYGNGLKLAGWKDPRVASVPAYLILYMVSGGWDNDPLDPRRLPADFEIDYVRAWQRKDLK